MPLTVLRGAGQRLSIEVGVTEIRLFTAPESNGRPRCELGIEIWPTVNLVTGVLRQMSDIDR
jgi:hypothetical protein